MSDALHLTVAEIQALQAARELLGRHTGSLWANKARAALTVCLKHTLLKDEVPA